MDFVNICYWITNIAALIPYPIYAFAYWYPAKFPCSQKTLIVWAKILKAINIVCCIPPILVEGFNFPGMVFGIPLMIIGQFLSISVFHAIGDKGVYLGNELGTIKPTLVNEFPFIFEDPMYKGSVIFIIGTFLITNVSTYTVGMLAVWIYSYIFAIFFEHTAPGMIK